MRTNNPSTLADLGARLARQLIGILCLSFTVVSAYAGDIHGKAYVVDGDSLHIGRTKIRLIGIDAPEMDQSCQDEHAQSYRCGQMAKQVLQRLIRSRPVRCASDRRDQYGRRLAVCYVGQYNLNAEMVQRGWAVVYRYRPKKRRNSQSNKQYNTPNYSAQAQRARLDRRGLWRGTFQLPWKWRRR